MAYTYAGPVQIELVQWVKSRIFQSRFLDTWGEGVQHIGWYIDDVDAAVASLTGQGVKLFVHDPGKYAYLDADSVGGAIFKLRKKG